MKLTPIKVRGRGGPSKPWQPPASAIANNKKRKAPEGGHDDTHDAISKTILNLRKKRARIDKRPTSFDERLGAIEKLPSEVLEEIINTSENLNLLRSSFYVGKRFTRKIAMRYVIIGAFGETWNRWHSITRDQIREIEYRRVLQGFLPCDDDAGGNPAFQSGILACEWVTIDDLLRAQRVWYRRSKKPRYTRDNPWAWWKARKSEPRNENSVQEFDLEDRPVMDASAVFKQDWVTLLREFQNPRAELDPDKLEYTEYPFTGGYTELHPRTRVPDHLLVGPWSLDKIKYLFWLVRGGAKMLDSHNFELTKRGYESIFAITITDKELTMLARMRPIKREEKDDETKKKEEEEEREGDSSDEKEKDVDDFIPIPEMTTQGIQKILVFLYSKLGVFDNHWPMHILQEKFEEAQDKSKDRRDVYALAEGMIQDSLLAKMKEMDLAQATRRAAGGLVRWSL